MSKTYQPNDKYAQKAQQMGYRARSVFKLEEIQERYKLMKSGNKVLDLGAAPGSFSQLAAKVVGEKGMVIGVDIKSIKPFSNKRWNFFPYQGDIFNDQVYEQIEKDHQLTKFDVIISDLAPNTSGIASVDAGRSFELNEKVIEVADKYLKRNGCLLMKSFQGSEQSRLLQMLKEKYDRHHVMTPKAVRKSSREVYVIGFRKK